MVVDADATFLKPGGFLKSIWSSPCEGTLPGCWAAVRGTISGSWVASLATEGLPSCAPLILERWLLRGGKLGEACRAPVGSQTLSNAKERLLDLDREGIDVQFLYPGFLLLVNSWADRVLGNGVCRATTLGWRRFARRLLIAWSEVTMFWILQKQGSLASIPG